MPYITVIHLNFMEAYDSDLMDLHRTWTSQTPDCLEKDPALMRRALSSSSPVGLIQQILYRATGETLKGALKDVSETGTFFEKGRVVAASGQHNLAHLLFSKAAEESVDFKEQVRIIRCLLPGSSKEEAKALFEVVKREGIVEIYHAYAQYLFSHKMEIEAEAVLEEGMEAGDLQSYMLTLFWLKEKESKLRGLEKIKNVIAFSKVLMRGTLAGLNVARDSRALASMLIPSGKEGAPLNMPQALGVSA